MRKIITITILALVLTTSLVVSTSAAAIPFNDVPEKAWYYKTVVEAYEKGIMKGTSETEFAPLKTMSRSEFVTLLYRLTGVTDTGFGAKLESFDDGVDGKWYSEAMGWGVERGLIKGFTDNTVRPMQTITRAELAVMIERYLAYMGYSLPETVEESAFTDNAKIAKWCREQIYTCQRWGIFKGDNEGKFNPSSEASRAEGATIVLRLSNSINELLENEGAVIARENEKSAFTVLYTFIGANEQDMAKSFVGRFNVEFGYQFDCKPYVTSNTMAERNQIILNVAADPVIAEMTEKLGDSGYAVKLVKNGEYTKLYVAYTSNFAKTYAVELLLTKYVKDGTLALPVDLEISKDVLPEDFLIIDDSITQNCRDPFVLYENGIYYVYVTGWRAYKSTSVEGPWEEIPGVVERPADYSKCNWAPEVHKYNGSYYMFTTYSPKETLNPYENHGCIIMKSDSPEGPFKMITDGWITPEEWDCIDGTLYVDGDGQPWMVFVHEHTSLEGNGAFAAAKLSEDFTHFISEPIELFRARDAHWAIGGITDGCFMYTTEEGELLMLWSNNDAKGYCLAVARSSNGRLDGEWTHDDPLLFSELNIDIDGGHGMIFTAEDGQMYASLHAPNDWGGNGSKLTLLPITERNGMLVWDLDVEK